MIVTDGTWSTDDRHAYFLAGGHGQGDPGIHPFTLIGVNDLVDLNTRQLRPRTVELVESMLDGGIRLIMDSGVFFLTGEHMRAHGLTGEQAFGLAPADIDGFDALWAGYLEVHRTFGQRMWGYIEVDQGGEVNKRILRERLHDAGVMPMPVFHPLNDSGWDYFDELASTHDRVAVGNIARTRRGLRTRLLHTLDDRRRKHGEDLWVHVLGFKPNEWVNAFPMDSADSSSWLNAIRYGLVFDTALSFAFDTLPRSYVARRGEIDPADDGAEYRSGYQRGATMKAVQVSFQQRSWQHYMRRQREVLGPTYSPGPA